MNAQSIQRQRGATLLVTLIMLVVLTLFAVTGFNLSSVNLKIVGNFQQQKTVDAAVQQAIERVMSTVNLFSSPAEIVVCVPSGDVVAAPGNCAAVEHAIRVERPRCNYTTPAKGYTKVIGQLTPEDTNWDVRASYTDSVTKASAAVVQGVGVRMLAGNCPSWPY
jgi:Tfp pilus assembly protein PilX